MRRVVLVVVLILTLCIAMRAADWLTDAGNPQRTNWQKDETILTKQNVGNLKILWKLKLDNATLDPSALAPQARVIHVLNKIDVVPEADRPQLVQQVVASHASRNAPLLLSARTGEGTDAGTGLRYP